MKCDIDGLFRSFPHNRSESSRCIFKLVENTALAFANQASDADVRAIASEKTKGASSDQKAIVDSIIDLCIASEAKDDAAVALHDKRISDIFIRATGSPPDTSKMSWFSKLAVKK